MIAPERRLHVTRVHAFGFAWSRTIPLRIVTPLHVFVYREPVHKTAFRFC